MPRVGGSTATTTSGAPARDREKHDRILRFARRLPALREQVADDIALDGMPRERVLACAVRLLELGFFRVGGEAYAEENDTYGLATIRKQHVRVRGELLEFDYDAKSGQRRQCQVADDEVRAVITTLRRRRAPADAELLAYKVDRAWVDVRSSDINDYVQEHLGNEFSAKDFRTWVGTVLAAVGLANEDGGESETSRKRAVASVVKDVAEHLGNTPAVARSAYIDPRLVDRFERDDTIEDVLADVDIDDLERRGPRGGRAGGPRPHRSRRAAATGATGERGAVELAGPAGLRPGLALLHVDVVREPEDPLGDDVALDLAGAAADRERAGEQEAVVPHAAGHLARAVAREHPARPRQVLGQAHDRLAVLVGEDLADRRLRRPAARP